MRSIHRKYLLFYFKMKRAAIKSQKNKDKIKISPHRMTLKTSSKGHHIETESINRTFFIKLQDCEQNSWFNLNNIYDVVKTGNRINPVTNSIISDRDAENIINLYENQINCIELPDNDISVLKDQIEELEDKVEEHEMSKEDLYSQINLLRVQIEKNSEDISIINSLIDNEANL